MNKIIEDILITWHKHFEDDVYQYSEYEPSDIEYFVGCMIYNHFNFDYALATMKTIDLSYDFLSSCGDEYEDIKSKINSINIENENEKLKFLKSFLAESKAKYTQDELYLLDRLSYHVDAISSRYEKDEQAKRVKFVAPPKRNANPLLR
jgi:hypothetical protein